MDGDDVALPVPERHFVICSMEEIESGLSNVARQPNGPPSALQRGRFETNRAEIREGLDFVRYFVWKRRRRDEFKRMPGAELGQGFGQFQRVVSHARFWRYQRISINSNSH